MSCKPHRLSLLEKIGYGLGDAASSLVWRVMLAFLPVFYTDVYGLSAAAASLLLLVVRLSDGVSDLAVGMVADRTHSRWGTFRPWVFWSAPLLGLCTWLAFVTPDWGPGAKLVYAYITCWALALAYTINHVPYSALMGVMTHSHTERNVLSGYRAAGGFLGALLVAGLLLTLVDRLGQGDDALGYSRAMGLFGILIVVVLWLAFAICRERVTHREHRHHSLGFRLKDLLRNLPLVLAPVLALALLVYIQHWSAGVLLALSLAAVVFTLRRMQRQSAERLSPVQRDLLDLLNNSPWRVLLVVGFCFILFHAIKQAVVIYYFRWVVGDTLLAAHYLVALLAVSVVGALAAGYLVHHVDKKRLFIVSLLLASVLTAAKALLPSDAIVPLFVLGCAAELFTAVMPVLFFSMLGDAADYSEWKNRRRATGLVFAVGSFLHKVGSGLAGALVLLILAWQGYDNMLANGGDVAKPAMQALMSWIPAGFALAAAGALLFYPLSDRRMAQIEAELVSRRQEAEQEPHRPGLLI